MSGELVAITVEIWYDGAWHDISADCYNRDPVRITRGVRNEGVRADPARVSLTVNNGASKVAPGITGRYSPRNPRSDLYGKIGRNTPIRISATLGAVTSVRGVFEVTAWPPRWDLSGNDAWVPLQAAGILRRLGTPGSPVPSPLRRALVTSSPLAYWPCEDGVDSTQAASGIGGAPMSAARGLVDFVAAGPVGSAGSASPHTSADNQLRGPVVGGGSSGWQMSVWTRGVWNGTYDAAYIPMEVRTSTGWIIRLGRETNGGAAGAEFFIGAYATEGQSSPDHDLIRGGAGPLDDQWHLIQVILTQSGADVHLALYVDGGLLQDAYVWAGMTLGAPVDVRSIGRFGGGGTIGQNMTEVYVAHLAVHDTITLVDQWQAGQGYPGEAAGVRSRRLCTENGVPLYYGTGDDFEATPSPLAISGTWTRDTSRAHSGMYAMRSAVIADGGSTQMVVQVPSWATGCDFWYTCSTELSFDFLDVYVDSTLVHSYSGDDPWTQVYLDVAGASQVVFEYNKDASGSHGADAAWVDDLMFHRLGATMPMGPQRPAQLLDLLDECATAEAAGGAAPILTEQRDQLGLRWTCRDELYLTE